MKANYHTHTWRCNHAAGTEEEYFQAAIGRGLETLGFSDHTPYLFSSGYVSRIRMLPEQVDDYVSCLTSLKKKYSTQINTFIGVEAEYFPAYFRDTLTFLRDHGIEYMILGQHFIENEPDGIYSGKLTSDKEIMKQYCRQSLEAIQTGVFSYFAHPDLIQYVGDMDFYKKEMRHLIREAAACGIPMEINLLGILEGRHYPGQTFLECVAEENCPVIIGCDAHAPKQLSETAAEEKANALIRAYGLRVLEDISLHHI